MSYGRKPDLVSVVIDLETVRLPLSEEAKAKFDKEYVDEYKAPKNIKDPAKLEAHRVSWEAEKADRYTAALAERDAKDAFKLYRNRMISCALGVIGEGDVQDIQSWYGDDPAAILKGALSYLDDVGQFRFVGWNCQKFDLPILAKHMGEAGLRLPRRQGKWDVVDLCVHPFAYTELKECARAFGLTVPPIDGADVARLYEDRQWEDISKYNESDVRLTGRLYLLASNLWEL